MFSPGDIDWEGGQETFWSEGNVLHFDRSWCDSLENNSQVPVYFRLFPQEKEKLVKGIGKVSRLKSRKGNQITESCKQRCDENW